MALCQASLGHHFAPARTSVPAAWDPGCVCRMFRVPIQSAERRTGTGAFQLALPLYAHKYESDLIDQCSSVLLLFVSLLSLHSSTWPGATVARIELELEPMSGPLSDRIDSFDLFAV